MAQLPKLEISIKDVDIVKDLFALTKEIIDDLEEEGCYPATIKKYRDKLESLIAPKQNEDI